jgi:hypothetical protein
VFIPGGFKFVVSYHRMMLVFELYVTIRRWDFIKRFYGGTVNQVRRKEEIFAWIVEQLQHLLKCCLCHIDLFNTLQKYIYIQNSRCLLFWNHFFSQWCTPQKEHDFFLQRVNVKDEAKKWWKCIFLNYNLKNPPGVPSQDL